MTEESLARHIRLGTILILEDEGLLSLMIEEIVREMGAEDIHVSGDIASAREIATHAMIDCAILDLVVRDGTSNEIADILEDRGIPFMFSTGSGREGIAAHHRHRPIINKPFADDDFRARLHDVILTARAAEQ